MAATTTVAWKLRHASVFRQKRSGCL